MNMRYQATAANLKESAVVHPAFLAEICPAHGVNQMNVSNKRFLIFGGLLCVVGVWCIWCSVTLFRGSSDPSGVKFASRDLEEERLRREVAEKDREILELKRALVASGETPTPKITGGNLQSKGQATLPSVSEKGAQMRVGSFQIEQQGPKALVTDDAGKPLFVFDSERRSIVAPNGMYIPREGRLVMADVPPVGTKSENAERPVKVGFKNESSGRLDVAWVNYDGKLTFYKTLQPGQSFEQETYETHPWVALNSAGKILDLIKPTKEDEDTQFIFAPGGAQKGGGPQK